MQQAAGFRGIKCVKCVVVGDSKVGKTALLSSYANRKQFVPTVFDNYSVSLVAYGKPIELNLWRISECAEYDAIRPLSYPETDVFLVCFSVVQPESFKQIKKKWHPEVSQYCPKVPVLLVGTQIDLRSSDNPPQEKKNMTHITTEVGRKLAKAIGAVKYVECSTVTQEGVKTVFDEVVQTALIPPKVEPETWWRRFTGLPQINRKQSFGRKSDKGQNESRQNHIISQPTTATASKEEAEEKSKEGEKSDLIQ